LVSIGGGEENVSQIFQPSAGHCYRIRHRLSRSRLGYEFVASIKLGSLSNRALLVNNLFDVVLYAGIRVVSAVAQNLGRQHPRTLIMRLPN
jgi:hypothetical protein